MGALLTFLISFLTVSASCSIFSCENGSCNTSELNDEETSNDSVLSKEFFLISAKVSKTFKCPGVGVYPEPTDCTTYYRCVSTTVYYTYTCPGKSYFDPTTKKCTTTLPAKCATTTTTTAKPSSTTTTTTTTVPPETAPPTTTTVPPETTPPTETTTLPPDSSNSTFVCPAAGTYPDPSDCKTYYRCTTTLIAYEYTCPGASYFDPVALKCTMTMPSSCATPTTTAAPETTTIASETTTVPSESSTETSENSTITTTVTPDTTPVPFICPAEGTYPATDTNDCKTYYRCTTTLIAYEYICPGASYFDPVALKCTMTMPSSCATPTTTAAAETTTIPS